jgi:hypothetical protein
MSISPDAAERTDRQARIEEDIRRLFARYRRQQPPEPAPTRRFTPKRSSEERTAAVRPPKSRA